MATVQTVQGPVDADELGTTLIHEHVRARDEGVAENWPGQYDPEVELTAALTAVNDAKDRGARAIVDPTAMFLGRDVRFMARVAEETGVRIVPCTGIYTYDYLPHYFENRSAEQIADLFVADIEQGIQGTDIKAAFLKCAADAPGVTEHVEKVHRAIAQASVRTGAPIMAHTRPASGTGPRQIEIFEDEGVDLGRVQLAHTGDTDDLDYIERVLEKGVFIGLDRYGLPMFLPTERRNPTTIELLRRGYGDRLFLGSDYCATIDWFPPEAIEGLVQGGLVSEDWSMVLVFDEVLSVLRDAGVFDDDVFRQVFVENPRRWLTGS